MRLTSESELDLSLRHQPLGKPLALGAQLDHAGIVGVEARLLFLEAPPS